MLLQDFATNLNINRKLLQSAGRVASEQVSKAVSFYDFMYNCPWSLVISKMCMDWFLHYKLEIVFLH